MSKSLDNALDGNAWSVSAVMFDLNAMHDDEGRPISERRADALARVGVEMEMKKCPFSGIRHDKWMNVSALTQIAHYYNDALAELSTFRYHAAGDGKENVTWDDILAGVIDQLAGPAIYLLQHRNLQGPVPAKIAVGHKLAAGMFGVLCELQERLAMGTEIPVSVDSFMHLIDETGALVGASEACAGSPPMIRKACVALIERKTEDKIETEVKFDKTRLELARNLALQVQLGTFWDLYDRVHLWSLIKGDYRNDLTPFNDFLLRKIEHAGNDLAKMAPSKPICTVLPYALDSQIRQTLAAALNDTADIEFLQEDLNIAKDLLNEPGSAIQFEGNKELFVSSVANYLNTYRLFETELSKIEIELRGYLNYSSKPAIRLGSAVFPAPKALHWYELILGRKLGESGRLTGNSTKKSRGAAVG